ADIWSCHGVYCPDNHSNDLATWRLYVGRNARMKCNYFLSANTCVWVLELFQAACGLLVMEKRDQADEGKL
ncbi:unnamed protein product, partial [Adineta ricciae]